MLHQQMIAQEVMSKITDRNNLFLGISNPVTVFSKRLPVSGIIVTTDNGTIAYESPGKYYISPAHWGKLNLKMFYKGKLIGEDMYYVSRLIPPTVFLGRVSEHADMSMAELNAQQGLRASIKEHNLNVAGKVKEFRLRIVRDGFLITDTVFKNGPIFDKKYREKIKVIKTDDEVVFSNFKISPIRGETQLRSALNAVIKINIE